MRRFNGSSTNTDPIICSSHYQAHRASFSLTVLLEQTREHVDNCSIRDSNAGDWRRPLPAVSQIDFLGCKLQCPPSDKFPNPLPPPLTHSLLLQFRCPLQNICQSAGLLSIGAFKCPTTCPISCRRSIIFRYGRASIVPSRVASGRSSPAMRGL